MTDEHAEVLRFVVLHHEGVDWPHYDLMFETSGESELQAWRCERWPIDRSATLTKLPNHRRIYLDYEGPISNGRGTVKRIFACRISASRSDDGARWVLNSSSPPMNLRLHHQQNDQWIVSRV